KRAEALQIIRLATVLNTRVTLVSLFIAALC
ncbi:hypothetical protein SEEGA711_20758, partial [Salmonella enterica subsp. enterica serovar Gaminara str. ATCC BAA-711]